MTPFVRNGRLMRAEIVSGGDYKIPIKNVYCVIQNVESGECSPLFARG